MPAALYGDGAYRPCCARSMTMRGRCWSWWRSRTPTGMPHGASPTADPGPPCSAGVALDSLMPQVEVGELTRRKLCGRRPLVPGRGAELTLDQSGHPGA